MLKLKNSTKVTISPKPIVMPKTSSVTYAAVAAWGIPKVSKEEPVEEEGKSPYEIFKITYDKWWAHFRGKCRDQLRLALLKTFYEKLQKLKEIRYQLAWPEAGSKKMEPPKKQTKGPSSVQQKIFADRRLARNPKPKLVILPEPWRYRRQATKEVSPLVTAGLYS
ncbi:hypothetical protein CAEBREN_03842 [Caenorhabditis brenneri]|uniref:Uncharacterized protein n=1 Tax=Caenorhabditis brenneri TaxID=135651 RepID=G0MDA8_CAEBE|nr:hypothetical protein CAEBREN_03842 [Caenorhabditis brenneri]